MNKSLFTDNIILLILLFVACFALSLLLVYFGGVSFLIIVGLLLFLLALFNNKYLLFFLLVFIPIFPKINLIEVPGTYVAIRAEDFVVILVLLSVLMAALFKRTEFKISKIIKYVLLYLGISFISYFVGLIQGTLDFNLMSALYCLRRVEYICLFFVAYLIADQNSIKDIQRSIIVALPIIAFIAFLQSFQVIGGFHLGQYVPVVGRAISTFSGPWELAAYLAIIFTYSVIGLIDERGFKRAFWAFIGTVELYVLMLTAARVEYLSIPSGMIVLGALKKKLVHILIIIILFSTLAYIMAPQGIKDRMATILNQNAFITVKDIIAGRETIDTERALTLETAQSSNYDLSAVIRVYKWISVYNEFMNYPVFGLGQSSFGEAVDGDYLRILAENGLVGLFVFFLLLHYIWKQALKVYSDGRNPADHRNYALFILVTVVNLLVMALFLDVFQASKIAFLFWAFVGVFFKIKEINEKNARKLSA